MPTPFLELSPYLEPLISSIKLGWKTAWKTSWSCHKPHEKIHDPMGQLLFRSWISCGECTWHFAVSLLKNYGVFGVGTKLPLVMFHIAMEHAPLSSMIHLQGEDFFASWNVQRVSPPFASMTMMTYLWKKWWCSSSPSVRTLAVAEYHLLELELRDGSDPSRKIVCSKISKILWWGLFSPCVYIYIYTHIFHVYTSIYTLYIYSQSMSSLPLSARAR